MMPTAFQVKNGEVHVVHTVGHRIRKHLSRNTWKQTQEIKHGAIPKNCQEKVAK